MLEAAAGEGGASSPRRPLALMARLTLAAVAGGLGHFCFAPVAAWWLLPFSLALLCVAFDGARGFKQGALIGGTHGLVFFGLSLTWLSTVHIAVMLLSLMLQLFHSVLGGWLIARALAAWPRAPRAVVFALAWMGAETIRGLGAYGFPWYLPAYSLPADFDLAQTAEIVGAFGLSYLMVALGGALAELASAALRLPAATRPATRAVSSLSCLGLVAILVFAGSRAGAALHDSLEVAPGPRVLVVQANIEQKIKSQTEPGSSWLDATTKKQHLELIFSAHLRLTLAHIESASDLIVWGETMYPQDLSSRRNARDTERVRDLVDAMQASLLIGGFRIEPDPTGDERAIVYNTAFYFTPQADREVCHLADAGHKRHLVPGGEYIPFGWLPGVKSLANRISGADLPDLRAGTDPIRLHLATRDGGEIPFGVFICYETFFPPLLVDLTVPDPAKNWPGARFLVTLSNEGWFGRSIELDQHLEVARWRAIEVRRSIVRATNTGITALIDPLGTVREVLRDEHEADREVSGVLAARPPLCEKSTVFAGLAGWIEIAALAGLALLALFPVKLPQANS